MASLAFHTASASPRIALIHATALAVTPINEAFARVWPQALLMNLLDDSLSADLAANQGRLSALMTQRFVDLARYAVGTGARAILFTCSAFGPAIAAAQEAVDVPALKPNEAMFEEALRRAPDSGAHLALIASFEPSLAPMAQEFRQLAEARGRKLALSLHHVPVAMAALAQGDRQTHDTLIADMAAQLHDRHLIMLAQFSMASAQAAAQARCEAIVLASPDCAVLALQRAVLAQHPSVLAP